MSVVLAGLTERQLQSWLGLLDVAADFPDGWCLVGGQMVHDAVGTIRRPSMVGALVAKAAAFSVPSDSAKERHLTDFATLAAMARGSDRISQQLTTRDRRYLIPMLAALDNSRRLWTSIEGAERGVVALARITATKSKQADLVPPSPTTAPGPPAPDL